MALLTRNSAIEIKPLSDIRARLRNLLDETGKEMKSDGGIDLLTGADREAADNLFDRLADYGLFCVRSGELECWLKGLNIKRHGPPWLIEMFTRMQSDPGDVDYVRPADNDVWKFVSELRAWTSDPKRKGIPI